MKAYGYDKVHESDSNKAAIVLAEKARDKEEATLKEHKDHVKFLKENDASIEEITNAQAYVTAQEKVLKSTETKVGELKNLGATQHLEHDSKQFFSRMERFFSSTSRKTLEKIKEENQKKWATAGESKRKRQDKASAKKLDKDLADDTPSGGSDKK
jgi:hypothetical protein